MSRQLFGSKFFTAASPLLNGNYGRLRQAIEDRGRYGALTRSDRKQAVQHAGGGQRSVKS